jgi:hypothetical protein
LTKTYVLGFSDDSSRSRAGTKGSNAGSSFDTESKTTNAIGRRCQVLLEWQILVYRYKGIEFSGGKCEQLAVLNPRPPGLNNRSHRMIG